jgi:predicted O-methyltransferase YrrM
VLAELWTGCATTDRAAVIISTDVDGEYLGVAVQLVTEADIDAAIRVIETFSFTGE